MKIKLARVALRTSVAYWIVSLTYIILSDVALERTFGGPFSANLAQTLKGFAFISVSAALLYFGLRAQLSKLAEQAEARRRAEEELRETSERFRQVVENIDEVFWISSPALDQMIYVSPTFEKLWGHKSEALFANPALWSEAIHPEDKDRVLAAARELRTLGRFNEEYRILRPDGATRWVRDRAFAMRDANGAILRVAGLAHDVTDRVQLETQLRHSQKMEAIGTLAGGIAHDFNNLLTVIKGNACLQQYEEIAISAAEQAEALREIIAASDRAAALTKQLLIFSRKQVMQPVVLDVNEVVANMVRMLERLVGAQIRISTEFASDAPTIRGDIGMIEQVIMNLSVNARDAMPSGGHLRIRTFSGICPETDGQPANCGGQCGLWLEVSDTGSGITPEHLPHLFEPFFTTKEIGAGTGLGLATVYGIVKQHGGSISVTSQPGNGATFTICLPAAQETAAPVPSMKLPVTLPPGTETILLVEDEAPLRTMIGRILTRLGYTVLAAETGEIAHELWRENRSRVDILVTDMMLPDGVSGSALATAFGAERPDLKIVYMSGYSPEFAGKSVELITGQNFIQKPFRPDTLVTTLRRALDEPAKTGMPA